MYKSTFTFFYEIPTTVDCTGTSYVYFNKKRWRSYIVTCNYGVQTEYVKALDFNFPVVNVLSTVMWFKWNIHTWIHTSMYTTLLHL